MADARVRGRFVWHDLMTSDPAKAVEFYTKVAGWGTQQWAGPQPYTMWTAAGTPLGGVVIQPPNSGAPPHWLAYVGTPDIDATVAHAQQLGARTLVPPTEIPNSGKFSVHNDPQGVAFALYMPGDEKAPEDGQPAVGQFSWHELVTTDAVAAFEFYSALFGWKKTSAMDMGPMGTYQMYGLDGIELGGMFNKPPEMPAVTWVHYIRIADINRGVEAVKSGGGQVLVEPMEVPGGNMIVQAMDPQGAMFALHATKK